MLAEMEYFFCNLSDYTEKVCCAKMNTVYSRLLNQTKYFIPSGKMIEALETLTSQPLVVLNMSMTPVCLPVDCSRIFRKYCPTFLPLHSITSIIFIHLFV